MSRPNPQPPTPGAGRSGLPIVPIFASLDDLSLTGTEDSHQSLLQIFSSEYIFHRKNDNDPPTALMKRQTVRRNSKNKITNLEGDSIEGLPVLGPGLGIGLGQKKFMEDDYDDHVGKKWGSKSKSISRSKVSVHSGAGRNDNSW